MKLLDKKKDELAKKFDEASWFGRRNLDYFEVGWDSCLKELEPMIKELVDTLEFYGNDINWNETEPGFSDRIDSFDNDKPYNNYIGYVGGKRARAALKKMRGSYE